MEEAYGQQEVEKDKNPDSWHRIHFSYDQNSHLVLVKDEFGAQMHYEYDCLGNVILEEHLIEEGIQHRTRCSYNKNGWLVQKTEYIQGNGEINKAVTSYGYDANGNLTSIKTPKGAEIRRTYDADSRMTKERILDRKNGIDLTASYTYDAAGKILKQTIIGADGERLETGWRYDLKDRLTHAENQSGAITRYLYDKNDQLIKEIHPYGYEKDADNGNGTSYAYDKNGSLIRVTNAFGELVQELSYNRSGLPITQTDVSGNQTDFTYESDGQLKEVRRENTRRQQTPRAVQQYEYNARGQITGIVDGNHEKTTYSTDGWGRITGTGFSDGVKEGYEYNYAGQVSRMALTETAMLSSTVITASEKYGSEQTSSVIKKPSSMMKKAISHSTQTATAGRCSAFTTSLAIRCMRKRLMQVEKIPILAHGTMTALAGWYMPCATDIPMSTPMTARKPERKAL